MSRTPTSLVNVPLDPSPRQASNAINYLLGRSSYLVVPVTGKPSSGAILWSGYLPVALTLFADNCSAKAQTGATGSPVFTLKINGSSAGTATFAGTAGTFAITTISIPAGALFEVVAPSPQDATLSDITLSIAVNR